MQHNNMARQFGQQALNIDLEPIISTYVPKYRCGNLYLVGIWWQKGQKDTEILLSIEFSFWF
jgi:hypothetical protein